jgi:uncharacterized RmlC-like cupin family protein
VEVDSVSAQTQPTDSTCRVIRAAPVLEGRQGVRMFAGIAAQTAGAQRICMHLITIPAGGRGHAHLHENHETALYMLSGKVITRYGERLEHEVTIRAGDFLYIPADLPHVPVNTSATESAELVLSRTDPNEQESVVLLPELDELLARAFPQHKRTV